MTKEVLMQYANSMKEIKELRKNIEYLETKIPRLEKRIADIECGETVKDKVMGGEGGLQSFVIEGVPLKEYTGKKMELHIKRELLKKRKDLLQATEMDLLFQTNEVEKYIRGIKDSFIRRIVRFRVVDNLSWNEVADRMGGNNTEDSVRMAFNRYFDKNCSICSEEKC